MKLFIVVVLACLAAVQAREISYQSIVPFREATRSSRIVNGFPASLGQFPYQVFLIGDGSLACGGSLISAEWVLTAAHCQCQTSGVPQITSFAPEPDTEEFNLPPKKQRIKFLYNKSDISMIDVSPNNGMPVALI
uniref:Peptidase S1 domain-containing protein n=1 Tax=Anopheles quadriannulatus TaxID=34691 RepID=A0A182XIW6_ANOQN